MPKRAKSNYTEEFKRSSAELAATSEEPLRQVSKDLGISVSTLHGWVEKYCPNKKIKNNAVEHTDLSAENKRLKKENALLKQERDILKKATAFFARETL